jgi:hypothetical protein
MTDPRAEQFAATMRDFDAHLDALAAEHDLELDDDDRQELFEASLRGGFTADATVAAFDELYGDDEYDDDDGATDQDLLRAGAVEAHLADAAERQDGEAQQMLAQDLAVALEHATERLGRRPTPAELERVSRALPAQAGFNERYTPAHLAKAFEQAGVKAWADMSPDEVNRTMAAAVTGPRQERTEYVLYDENGNPNSGEWNQWMLDRVEGRIDGDDWEDSE